MNFPKVTCSIVNKVLLYFCKIYSQGKKEDQINFKNELITHE